MVQVQRCVPGSYKTPLLTLLFYNFRFTPRAVFHVGNALYSQIVDLCMLAFQKTLDNKQMFKVADICQFAIALPLLIAGYSNGQLRVCGG